MGMRASRLPVAMSLAFALFAMLLPADAQPATKVPRVGLLRLEALFLFADPFTVTYQKRIFEKGAKPADLPVEQATKFELIVNARTAKTLGIVIPCSIPGRADRVIQ